MRSSPRSRRPAVAEAEMPKGYWIAHVDVNDPQGYQAYMQRNGEVFRKFGARHVVIEFKDYATALACYRSPEYQRLLALRQPHGTADIVIIEGYDGPQP